MKSDLSLLETLLGQSKEGIVVCDAKTQEALYVSGNIGQFFPDVSAEDLVGSDFAAFLKDVPDGPLYRLADKCKLGEDYTIEEYTEYAEKCWMVRGRTLESEGRRMMAHYFLDITNEYLQRTALRNRYYTEITMLSSVSPHAFGTYRINLTQNTMKMPLGRLPEGIRNIHPLSVDAFFNFLSIQCGSLRERETVAQIFDRRKLIRKYEAGNTRYTVEHSLNMNDENMLSMRTSIYMTKNYDTGDIEGIVYAEDLTREKIVEVLLEAVARNDYDVVYLIDGRRARAYEASIVRSNPERDIREEGISYKAYLEKLLSKMPKNSDSFLEVFDMFALENIRRELRYRPVYTVYYGTANEKGMLRHKKASFYKANVPGDMICNTVQDITGVVENATEREAELSDALGKVQNALNSRNAILTRLNRDIRSPLGSIIGFAEIARSEVEPGTKEEGYLDSICTAASSIRTIIDDILAYHQIGSKGVELMPERVDLPDFFEILQAKMLPRASERGLSFAMDVSRNVPRQVMTDRYRLEQILTRLLENTFAYNPANGYVRLSVTEEGRSDDWSDLNFSVYDSSPDVQAEYLSSLFEPIDPKVILEVESPEELDLGLTLAKGNIFAMGGRVEAKSLESQGNCVTLKLRFPILHEPGRGPRNVSLDDVQKEKVFVGKRILVVDDHRLNLAVSLNMAKMVGMEAVTARNGQEAVNKFRDANGRFDMILMDIWMPVMDGLEATRAIRREKRIGGDQVPIIAMTADAYDEDVKEFLAAGMNWYLTKPFEPEELYRVMAGFMV